MKVPSFGQELRERVKQDKLVCLTGVYDVFSATLAARHFEALFISGFGFAASFYGKPNIGLIAWSDIAAFVQRVRIALPSHYLLVDMDDGYGDPDVASHAVAAIAHAGASGIILEDQKRPHKCGHVAGKQIMDWDDFLIKLRSVLKTRRDLYLVARTDAVAEAEQLRRAHAFEEAGADAVLVDGIGNLRRLRTMADQLTLPLMFNQIAGGKSPRCSLTELRSAGVRLVNYSTPCLFAAQNAIEREMIRLKAEDGLLPADGVNVARCTATLQDNLNRRDARVAAPARESTPATAKAEVSG